MTDKKRRKPLQARAQATVSAILEASLQILEGEDPVNLTTNHIAGRAGVSIGTLYQYFRNLDEILAALGQQQAKTDRDQIAAIVKSNPSLGSIRAIVRVLMNPRNISQSTRLALSDALFRVRGQGVMSEHHLAFQDSIGGGEDLGFPMSREAAFVLTHAATGLLRAAAAEPELELAPDRLEDELVRMMESYIQALSALRSA